MSLRMPLGCEISRLVYNCNVSYEQKIPERFDMLGSTAELRVWSQEQLGNQKKLWKPR